MLSHNVHSLSGEQENKEEEEEEGTKDTRGLHFQQLKVMCTIDHGFLAAKIERIIIMIIANVCSWSH